jgi:endonuclease YncB( thermonuclease family)
MLVFVIVAVLLSVTPAAATIESYAIVRPDATLLIRQKVVRLHGLYIPSDGQLCGRIFRPARCASRAAVALDFKIQRFVCCHPVERYADGSLSAVCYANPSKFEDGEDLGAYLIGEGLALAGPEAPFEYRALERLAEARGLGLWGLQVDSIHRR